jgi:hypothetical protein
VRVEEKRLKDVGLVKGRRIILEVGGVLLEQLSCGRLCVVRRFQMMRSEVKLFGGT